MYKVPTLQDKILCAILYAGLFVPLITYLPIIWIIVARLKKIYLKEFVLYHCYQALLFNMLIFFLPNAFDLLLSFTVNLLDILFAIIPLTKLFSDGSSLNLLGIKSFILENYFIFIRILSFYAIIWTLRGKYTNIPPLSKAINHFLR